MSTKKNNPINRRSPDMSYDPVIPVKVETLFQDIKRDVGEVKAQLSSVTDGLHRKADRSEVVKLEEKFDTLQRIGSDTAIRAEKDVDEVKRRVEHLERDSATNSAVAANAARLVDQERTSKFQWITIGVALLAIAVELFLQLTHNH